MLLLLIQLLTQFGVITTVTYYNSQTNDGNNDYELLSEHVVNLPAGKFPEPDCTYRVHPVDKNRPVLNRQVQIGEPVYHHWSCGGTTNSITLYCILVNNCTVQSAKLGKPVVPIIDEFGCSLFPSVLPHVHYNDDLDGGLRTSAFALDVEQPAVTFNCNIKLLLKIHGVCRRPRCIPLEWYQQQPMIGHHTFLYSR